MVAHSIVIATLGVLAIASLRISDQAQLQLLVQLGVALPASICAGMMLIFDSALRVETKASDPARISIATGFLFFAALHVIFGVEAVFPGLAFKPADILALIGLTPDFVRGIALIAIAIGVHALLHHFDAGGLSR